VCRQRTALHRATLRTANDPLLPRMVALPSPPPFVCSIASTAAQHDAKVSVDSNPALTQALSVMTLCTRTYHYAIRRLPDRRHHPSLASHEVAAVVVRGRCGRCTDLLKRSYLTCFLFVSYQNCRRCRCTYTRGYKHLRLYTNT
jgi:hypothetical protein